MNWRTVYHCSLDFLGLDSDIALYGLIIVSIFWLFAVRKVNPIWIWHVYIKAAIIIALSTLALTSGPRWLCAYGAWLFLFIFYVCPIILYKKLQTALYQNNCSALSNISKWQRLINWGKQGQCLYDTTAALSLYLQGEKKAADTILDNWLDQKLPATLKSQIADIRLQGLLWTKDWQQIISEYEKHEIDGSAISVTLSILAGRAYCESGNFSKAADCINAAAILQSRNDIYYLAMSLLFFYSLIGASKETLHLISAMSRYKYPLPDYIKFFWLGRLYQTKEDQSRSDKFFAAALKAAQGLPNWQKRIKEAQESSAGITQANIDSPRLIEPSRHKLARAMSVQELISPQYGFKTVTFIVTSLVLVFLISHSYSLLPNPVTYTMEMTCYEKGILSPARVLSGEYWRLFSFLFLHVNLVHALLNIIALLWLGKMAEKIYGAISFLLIYFLSGILSGIVSVIFCPAMPAVGASGAIMGVFGAAGVGIFRLKKFLPATIRKKYLRLMIGLLLFQTIIDQIIPHIDVSAHLGGLVCGILLGCLLPLKQDHRKEQ